MMKSNSKINPYWWSVIISLIVLFSISMVFAADEIVSSPDIEKISQMRDKQAISAQKAKFLKLSEQMRQVKSRDVRNPKKLERDMALPKNPFNSTGDGILPSPSSREIFFNSGRMSMTTPPNPINVMINNAEADTIVQGDDIILTIDFSDSSFEADIAIWIDFDGDGLFDPDVDMQIDDSEQIMDNDMEDEDSAWGRYQMTMHGDDDEGPNRVSNLGIFFEAMDIGGSDVGYVYIEPLNGP